MSAIPLCSPMTLMFGDPRFGVSDVTCSSMPVNTLATVQVSAAGRYFAILTEDGTVFRGVMETAAGSPDRFQYNGVFRQVRWSSSSGDSALDRRLGVEATRGGRIRQVATTVTGITCLDVDGILRFWPLKLDKKSSAGELMCGDVVTVLSDVAAVNHLTL